MKLARKAIAVVVLTAAFVTQAEASSTAETIGNLNYGQLYSFGNLLSTGTSFNDTLNFSLNTLSDLGGIVGETGISGFTATISGGSLSTPTSLTSQYFLTDLTAGSYTMTFKGVASSGSSLVPNIYGTFFSVAAVPEPDTWLMLLIGAGLVGFQLRRKQKVLRHRPLVAG
jgi:hypothetical protein